MAQQQNTCSPSGEKFDKILSPERSVESASPLRDSRLVLLKNLSLPAKTSPVATLANAATEGRQKGSPESTTPIIKEEHQKAFRLLEDVKEFIPQITEENERLRQNLVELRSQAEMRIEAAEEHAREWKSAAEGLKEQLETLEAMVLDLRCKLQRAEAVAAVERELSTKASQEAAEAECLTKLFEDAVIQSFGIGTMFQDALGRLGTPVA